jgi:DNA-binding response OmpR family regulator
MKLNALLMSRDQDAVHTLAALLDHLGIKGEVCFNAPDALDLMATFPYSAILLDFEIPAAPQVARLVRSNHPVASRPVIFAMIGALNHIAGAFASGADFVLYKPLAHDQVLRSLRAAQAFMLADRRRSQRHTLETLAYLQFGIAAIPALVLDVNDDGISIQSPEPLPGVREFRLRFVLPGTSEVVEANVDLIWADREGRAGMLFADMHPRCRRSLQQWLRKRTSRKHAGHVHIGAERAHASASAH